jgi:CheY-like chemotaxis protein
MVSGILNDVNQSLSLVLGHLDRASQAVDTGGSSLRVLVVDDSASMRELMVMLLRQAGHSALGAESAAAALDRLEASTFDVVVSDLSLGEGDNGWGLARIVAERWPGVGFILATGWAPVVKREQLEAAGVDRVLAKPFRSAQLREAVIRVALGHSWVVPS